MEGRRPSELGGVGGDAAERAEELSLVGAERAQLRHKRVRVRLLLRAEAREAAPAVERAERAASRLRDGAEAGDAARDHDAREPCALAFDAHAVPRDVR